MLTQQDLDQLSLANKVKKYGHLSKWELLYCYQRLEGTPITHIKEIGEYAKRSLKGERIVLPLMWHVKQQETIPVVLDVPDITSSV